MPALTVTKTISYTDDASGVSYDLTAAKVKVARHGYRQTITCSGQRRLLEMNSFPTYTKLVFFRVKNVGGFDLTLRVTSGTGTADITIPPGRCWELFNTNHWNDASATDPDTVDEIIGFTSSGDTKAQVDALFA